MEKDRSATGTNGRRSGQATWACWDPVDICTTKLPDVLGREIDELVVYGKKMGHCSFASPATQLPAWQNPPELPTTWQIPHQATAPNTRPASWAEPSSPLHFASSNQVERESSLY